jgi:hypothetical protein
LATSSDPETNDMVTIKTGNDREAIDVHCAQKLPCTMQGAWEVLVLTWHVKRENIMELCRHQKKY